MKEENPSYVLRYDDVAEYVWERLTERGYVPQADEVLDITDIAMDLFLLITEAAGGEVHRIEDDEELEEE